MRLISRLFLSLILGLAALAGPALAQDGGNCPALLTITGNVGNPNRGGYDPETDKFFGYFEVEFDKAYAFDCRGLKGLAIQTVHADFPKGRQVHTYEGPLLADVLAAAGATGETVTVQALDGYAVEVPMADLAAAGAVVALSRDGHPFGIGDFGPTQIVFPRGDRADLKDMSDDWWVWSIFHIRVE
jgi:hypothetical protein